MLLRVKPRPTRFPTNSLYTPMDNTPLHSILCVCHGCSPICATGGSLPCGRYLLAPLTGNKDGSMGLMVLQVKPTPTRFPTNSLYTPIDNIPSCSISSVCRPCHLLFLTVVFMINQGLTSISGSGSWCPLKKALVSNISRCRGSISPKDGRGGGGGQEEKAIIIPNAWDAVEYRNYLSSWQLDSCAFRTTP